jgi:hypothetical protein
MKPSGVRDGFCTTCLDHDQGKSYDAREPSREQEESLSPNARRIRLVISMIALVTVAAAATGCGIIRPTRGRHFEEAERSGFLRDYSQLKPQEGYDAQEIYVRPSTPWKDYSAIYIESVSLWIKDESKKPSAEDQKKITDMLYKSLNDKLSENFKIVDRPGPGVIQIRAALTEAKGARVALNTVTTVIPQARAVSTIVGLGTDTAALVGAASMEAEATDSITGRSPGRRDRLARGHQGHHAHALEVGRRRGDLRPLGRAGPRLLREAGSPAEAGREEVLSQAAGSAGRVTAVAGWSHARMSS